MRIYQLGPAISPPKLSNIGIRVQTICNRMTDQAAAPAEDKPTAMDTLERQGLVNLSAQREQPIQVFASGNPSAFSIQPGDQNTSHLLEALRQVGERLDLPAALNLHAAASNLVSVIRQQNTLPAQSPLKLVLSGAFGQIELDLARLEPQQLKATFDNHLAQQPVADLQGTHSQIAGLSEQIRSGFGLQNSRALSTDWLPALTRPDFRPDIFFQQTLGCNPLDSESSLNHLLDNISAQSSPPAFTAIGALLAVPHNSATPTEPTNLQVRQNQIKTEARTWALATSRPVIESQESQQANLEETQELAEKSADLIEIANQLENKLELNPSIQAPDILQLLQSFQTIVRQLDHDVGQILSHQNQEKQFTHKLLAQFAEQLKGNLRFNKERISALEDSGSERLKLLIHQSLTHIKAKVWLASEHSGGLILKEASTLLQTQ